MARADPARGAPVVAQCADCGAVERGGSHKAGPNLHDTVVGPVATSDGVRHSDVLIAHGRGWTIARLDALSAWPKAEMRSTMPGFVGSRRAKDGANLVADLNTVSDDPLLLAASAGATTSDAGADSDADDEYAFGVLFDAPGVEATYYACAACHSERIVAQQGLSRAAWDKLFDWMVEEQGMAELDEPDRTEILDYLAAHYNEDRPNFPRPLGN